MLIVVANIMSSRVCRSCDVDKPFAVAPADEKAFRRKEAVCVRALPDCEGGGIRNLEVFGFPFRVESLNEACCAYLFC